jgi:hypothetical protein
MRCMDTPPYQPPVTNADRAGDEQHLKLLSVFYYIYGGLTAIGGCFGLIYVAIGLGFLFGPDIVEDEDVPAQLIGGAMAIFGGCFTLVLLAIGALIIYAGVCLSRKRNYIFCMVIAAILCLNIPLGTLLGVFTFVVLSRPSVKAMFERPRTY